MTNNPQIFDQKWFQFTSKLEEGKEIMCLYFIKEYQTSSGKKNLLAVLISYCTIVKNKKREIMDTILNLMFDVKEKKKVIFFGAHWSSQMKQLTYNHDAAGIPKSNLSLRFEGRLLQHTVYEHYHKLIYSYWQNLHLDSKWRNR